MEHRLARTRARDGKFDGIRQRPKLYARRPVHASDVAEQRQNEQDHEDEANAAETVLTRPRRANIRAANAPGEDEDQQNDKDEPHSEAAKRVK
jgi:hypothetical protein